MYLRARIYINNDYVRNEHLHFRINVVLTPRSKRKMEIEKCMRMSYYDWYDFKNIIKSIALLSVSQRFDFITKRGFDMSMKSVSQSVDRMFVRLEKKDEEVKKFIIKRAKEKIIERLNV
jgi:hypothetical protein